MFDTGEAVRRLLFLTFKFRMEYNGMGKETSDGIGGARGLAKF